MADRLRDLRQDNSAANRTIADHFARNPVQAASASIEQMARATGLSTATLSRFARAAGERSYAALRQTMASDLQSILHPVEKLRAVAAKGPKAANGALEIPLDNLRACADGLPVALLRACARRVAAARCVYVMGFGLSAYVAGILSLGLEPFCRKLINVVDYGGDEVAAGRLMNIGRGDLLIVITLPRYGKAAIQLSGYARDRHATILALTDAPASPVVPFADHVLYAPSSHPVLPGSTVAAVLVAEALVVALMVSRERNVVQAARLTDAIAAHLHATPRPPGAAAPTTRPNGRGFRA